MTRWQRAYQWWFSYDQGGRIRLCRFTMAVLAIMWAVILTAIVLLFSHSHAQAAGLRVYLEDERDLGNGYKQCLYSEGVVITIQSHKLCPLSIEV